MIEYVYLPNYDGEGSVFVADEVFLTLRLITDCANDLACEYPLDKHALSSDFHREDVEGAQVAELVVSMDLANHGQDLTADFILEATHLIREGIAVDYGNGDTPKVGYNTLADWDQVAETVRKHNDYRYKGECPDDDACDSIQDVSLYSVEPILVDYGYVVEWDDGVRVFKVDDSG